MTYRLEHFLELSRDLTAFSRFDLLGTGLAELYLQTLDDVLGAGLTNDLLSRHQALQLIPDRNVRKQALRVTILGDERLGDVARALTKLWYSGTWFELPHGWSERYGPQPKDTTFVVSPNAYVEGLLWKAIGAHPAGAKAPGYGSWKTPPVIPSIPAGL